VVSFRNVHVKGGEIGIRATDMCSTLISCCTEVRSGLLFYFVIINT
jgi:hypothetical protein